MMLVASANACQGRDPSMCHCHCASSALPMLVGDPAVTSSGGCAWGSTGVDLIALPGSLGCAGAVAKEACGELEGAILNLPLTQRCTNKTRLSSLISGCPPPSGFQEPWAQVILVMSGSFRMCLD